MAPWNSVPIETYLRTRYRPDCDYLEGELHGRNECLRPHSDAMVLISSLLQASLEAAGLHAGLSLRLRISDTRYRIVDVCVFSPAEEDTIPTLCIEILSAEQTLHDMVERVADYRLLGVPEVWIVAPNRQQAWIVVGETFEPQNVLLTTADRKVQLPLSKLYEELEQDWPLTDAGQRVAETIAMLKPSARTGQRVGSFQKRIRTSTPEFA